MKLSNIPENIIPKSTYPTIKEYAYILIGLFLISCGWKWFIIPFHVTGGGATGISAVLQYGFNVPIYVSYFVINSLLLIVAIKKLGWAFSIKTIFSVIMLTIAFALNPAMEPGQLVDKNDTFLSVIIGAMLNGVGIGIVFLNNGSTGGTDIVARLLTQTRSMTLGRAMLYCDVLIIASSYLVTNELTKVIYGLLTMLVTATTVDLVVNGVRQSVQFFIFSAEYERIADVITNELGRGVTMLDGKGWYSKESIKVLTVLARKNESTKIFKLIKSIDPNAFVSQTSAIGVYGKGFDVIKTS